MQNQLLVMAGYWKMKLVIMDISASATGLSYNNKKIYIINQTGHVKIK